MPTFSGKRNASRLPKRGVLAVASTTTLPRRSRRGANPPAPAADVTGTGEAAAADTGTVCAAAATVVNTSSRHSGRNTISGSDAATSTTSSAPNAGSTINAPSSGPSSLSRLVQSERSSKSSTCMQHQGAEVFKYSTR